MNEATVNSTAHLFLGANRLLFDGPLRMLDWHQHAFVCVLLGVDGTITITGRDGVALVGRVVVAGAALEHRLAFEATRVLSLYIPAHDPAFEALSHTLNQALILDWSSAWEEALRGWDEGRDAGLLSAQLEEVLCRKEHPFMDRRVRDLTRRLYCGDLLKSGTREVAADLGISASRLSALLKGSTGSSLGKLQIAYRFWHAARAMLEVETFTDAAHAASFADAAHFSRSFRQAYGLPPSAIVIEKTAFWHCESLG